MIKWETYKLGDLCKISSSKRIFAKEYKDSGIPFYRGKEIIEKQKGNKISTELYISQERYDEIKAKHGVPQKDDMLLTSVGTLGIPYIVQDEVFYFKDGNLTWFYDFEDLDSRYLYYWFLSPIGKMNIDSKAIGSTQKAITIETLSKLEISLPPLEEQRRIAGILGAIDDKIENNRRINENLEQQAQALFDNLMSNSNLTYKLIADLDHIIETGRRPKGGVANITSGVPSIGAENIKGFGKYDYSKTKYVTAEFAEMMKKGVIKGYELLIYKDGGKPGYFIPNFSIFGEGFPYDDMTLNEHVFLLDFGNKGYNFFAYFYMQTEEVMKYLNAQGSKAAIPGINRYDVESISIPTIENNVVKEFCTMVEPIITSILVNSKESSRLATLRDTLLPKIMNGELNIDGVR